MMTYLEIKDLIDTNLADCSGITPLEIRETMCAILDFANENITAGQYITVSYSGVFNTNSNTSVFLPSSDPFSNILASKKITAIVLKVINGGSGIHVYNFGANDATVVGSPPQGSGVLNSSGNWIAVRTGDLTGADYTVEITYIN